MRVGLDARCLGAAMRSGVERYVVSLVSALAEVSQAPEIIAYSDGPISDPELAALVSRAPFTSRVLRARRGWLQVALPWRLWIDRVDLAHFPSTILPRFLPCPAVVTVHDLAWKRFPECYAEDDLAMQERALASAHRAALILAVSETTARDLVAAGVPPDRIKVTPLGVAAAFSPTGPRVTADLLPAMRQFLSPGSEEVSPYLLYVGGLQPRKNLERLLEAYRQVSNNQVVPPLVLAGPLGAHGLALQERAARLGLAHSVVFTGHVPEQALPALYRGAIGFVYISLYEGFGLPVLEAMASGVPVVASRGSGPEEVAGGAALLVNPEDTDEVASALARLLSDEVLRAQLSQRGLRRSRQFTWENTARATVTAYRQVVG